VALGKVAEARDQVELKKRFVDPNLIGYHPPFRCRAPRKPLVASGRKSVEEPQNK